MFGREEIIAKARRRLDEIDAERKRHEKWARVGLAVLGLGLLLQLVALGLALHAIGRS